MKLKVKDFLGTRLKVGKKKNGEHYINFTPIIDRANELVKKQLKPSFLVFYTKDCSPHYKSFTTEKAALRFAEAHEKLNTVQFGDDWVDCIIEGKVIKMYKNCYSKG